MAMQILVAYDGSEMSNHAVEEAKAKAKEHPGSVIHVITVVFGTGPVTNAAFMRNIGHELAEKYESDMVQVRTEIEEAQLTAVTNVLVGETNRNPGATICNYAKEHKIDLIIMGNRGLGGVQKLLLGSVSNHVVNHSACPVLVMK
ncbi:universal stress protein [Halobacillus salinarum]|uniref:Universal stress protein n=1 Tax=Halobacillus salinarum TaxID=2932257 RepID=A0ABY4EM90_9BACI|nr:universal stress protein [Halobacillus salinarum]UOQ44973.1 universal stress protein [Halobacillus salinarum]